MGACHAPGTKRIAVHARGHGPRLRENMTEQATKSALFRLILVLLGFSGLRHAMPSIR